MILLIVYNFLKKHNYLRWTTRNSYNSLVSFLTIFFLFMPLVSKAQILQLNYKIIRNGNDIGWLRLEKTTAENKTQLLLFSEVKTKIIFPIAVFAKESSVFENGKLIYSSQIRKINGTTKLDKQTRLIANQYEVFSNSESQKLIFSAITTNLLQLYFQEPIVSKLVYCDNLQCFVKVIKTADGGYKIKFPSGNTNCYYYKDGVCIKIKIEHTFYSATIISNLQNNTYANN